MFYSISIILLAFLLDLVLGDPEWMPHPIRWVGRLIAGLEPPLRRLFPKTPRGEFWGGTVLTLTVIFLTGGVIFAAVWLADRVHPLFSFLLETWLCYYTLAARSLRVESMKVYEKLKIKDLEGARKAVGRIVGRDTDRLDARGVTRAAVETVAENASDGEIAPLFYMVIGGAPLAFFYKAINTLDSMIGYNNEKYGFFGRFAARLDDAANFIPARLAALFMIAASFLTGLNGAGAARVWKRDRRAHKSPNSAQTEAVCAGALGVRLAGDAVYGGKVVKKPTIGEDIRPVAIEDIRRANRLMYAASLLALAVFLAVKLLVLIFWVY